MLLDQFQYKILKKNNVIPYGAAHGYVLRLPIHCLQSSGENQVINLPKAGAQNLRNYFPLPHCQNSYSILNN